jgi:radical SAM protein with 4Fe4S-binding SPASM domain
MPQMKVIISSQQPKHDKMLLRAKTHNLIQTRKLTAEKVQNTELNIQEIHNKNFALNSYPQRFVFEMTNACNLNCVMCGRNAKHFRPVYFNINWLKKLEPIAANVEEVTLMGWGEPTMHPQFVDFLKWAESFGMRKYFCTNGMKLSEFLPTIFEHKVDVIAISLDAADYERNKEIRRGADFDIIINNLKNVVAEKKRNGTPWPYMNFVTTLMRKNLCEFPKIVRLASEIGLEEAKGVFLTVFDDAMAGESLYNSMDEVKETFDEACKIAAETGVKLKIPHLHGEDPAGDAFHKPCYATWRDFFLGSDGYVRPCMSTPIKFFHIDDYATFNEMWNSKKLIEFRKNVNMDSAMDISCKRCYQSSFANWNRKSSFYQIGQEFSPEWDDIYNIPPPPKKTNDHQTNN